MIKLPRHIGHFVIKTRTAVIMSDDATPPDQGDLQEIQKAFRIYDKDHNGYVTLQVCSLEEGSPWMLSLSSSSDSYFSVFVCLPVCLFLGLPVCLFRLFCLSVCFCLCRLHLQLQHRLQLKRQFQSKLQLRRLCSQNHC